MVSAAAEGFAVFIAADGDVLAVSFALAFVNGGAAATEAIGSASGTVVRSADPLQSLGRRSQHLRRSAHKAFIALIAFVP